MITQTKKTPIIQPSFYSGYVFCLANLLNNAYVRTEVIRYKLHGNDYYRNYLYHKYTNQKTNPLTFVEKKFLKRKFPYSIENKREKDMFMFSELNTSETYKIYFIDVNLTAQREHEILVLKPMSDISKIIVVDPMNEYIMEMSGEDLFNEYYVMGYSILIDKKKNIYYMNKEQLNHLIGIEQITEKVKSTFKSRKAKAKKKIKTIK